MQSVYTRRRLLVAGAVAAIPLGTWWALSASRESTDSTDSTDSTGPTSPAASSPVDAAPGISSTTTSTSQPAPTPVPALDRDLAEGMTGTDVGALQQRLADLAVDPGPVDGHFGSLTEQAVWAFEKLVMGTPRSQATGRVTADTWARVHDTVSIQPRRPTGGLADHVEIYLPEQVMVVFHADRPALVAHVSTGELREGATGFVPWYENAAEYRETITIDTDINGIPLPEPERRAVIGWSYTPPGVFEAYRRIDGPRNGPLGSMWDPTYINQGIAIHGATNVPLEPASHGCIRVSRYLGERLSSLIDLGDRVLIWDGETEPEQQSEEVRKMRWDQPDPDATTTTTTSTSTTTTTTTVPTTTDVPTTTTAPPPSATTSTTTVPPTTTTTVSGGG
jgi:L,D-transpeptidase catalytic domain/Putative peptidoglycan binding domain